MSKFSYYVDNTVPASVKELLNTFNIHGMRAEKAIQKALSLFDQPFILTLVKSEQLDLSPLQDAFAFDLETDELILYSAEQDILLDALIEMAMYLRGFNTLIGLEEEWKVRIAIGAWRYVRERLKDELGISTSTEKNWSVSLEMDAVGEYDYISFNAMVFFAGRPDIEVVFPDNADKQVLDVYRRLVQIVEAVALNILLDDYAVFNQRLNRALLWIEETIMPDGLPSFGDLFGPEDISDKG